MKAGVMGSDVTGKKQLRTNHAHVVHQLGLEIVRGTLPVGAILPGDAELMARFGVSRTVLREALKTLTAKGMIRPKAKIGTRILERSSWNLFDADMLKWHFECGISREFLASLSEIRAALEPEAAALASRRRSDHDLARLYHLADRMRAPENTPETFAAVDLEFHIAVAQASRNPFMRSISALIEVALAAAFKLTSPATDFDRLQESAAAHRRIAEAIERRDPDSARAAMLHVIKVGDERVDEATSNLMISA